MSEVILEAVKTGLGKVNDRIAEIERMQEKQALKVHELQQKSGIGGSLLSAAGLGGGELATKMRDSEGWRGFMDGQKSSGRIKLDMPIDRLALQTKSATVSSQGASSSNANTIDVQSQRIPGLFGYGYRGLRLLDVLRRLPTTSNTVTYVRLNNYTNAAAGQGAEGNLKAEASVDTTLVSAEIETIAHFLPVSRQVLTDEPGLQASLDRLMRHGIADKLESQIINGGGGQLEIEGFLSAGTAFTPTAATLADAISECAADMVDGGYSPGIVLMNGNTWHKLRTERDNESAYLVGTWATPAAPSIWSIPVIATPSVQPGAAILVDLEQVAILDRMQAIVEASEHDGDNFRRNLVTLRAELRAGLMVADALGVRLLSDPSVSSV